MIWSIGLAVKQQSKKENVTAKDPDKPKRPPSAFFIFMHDFRKEYNEKHPNNKSIAAIGKAGGDKWKSMSVEEKAPFVAKAEKRKQEYECKMEAYNKKLAAGGGKDETDKSRSEVNDGEDEEVERLAVKHSKEKKAAKDQNKPKRPACAFFIFMEDFRKQYNEKHPNNKSIAGMGKAGGDKWKLMSDEEKAPFVAKAEKRKEEYEHKMQAYNKKLEEEDDDE